MATPISKTYIFTQVLTILALIAIVWLGLLPALLSGLFVYFIVEFGSKLLNRIGVIPATGKMILLFFVVVIILSLLVTGILSLISFLSEGQESLTVLLRRMADIVSSAKNYIPIWAHDYLPASIEDWQREISNWLRNHSGSLGLFGKGVGMTLVHIIFGMIIGGFLVVSPSTKSKGILAIELKERVTFVGRAFQRIVFSQFKISSLNTFLTSIFLAAVLPLMGCHLPFLKTIIAITFIVGMLPVVGNLISNGVILLIALSVSPAAVVASLIFLVVIHKLEYFFNAHIIGLQINSRAWELLIAMLVMETVFGIAGLVAAPIYYAYLKDELTAQKLI